MGLSKQYEYVIFLHDRFSDTMKRVQSISTGSYNRMIADQNRLNTSTNEFGRTIRRVFGTYLGIHTINNVTNTAAKFDSLNNSIEFISGSSKEAAQNFKFIDDITNRMGLNLVSTTEGFKTFSASFKGTKISMDEQRKMFEQVSTAVASMNLDAQRTELVFLAMGQMASKGVVSMEELRRQMGDSIPGAFSNAAKAMGVSQMELNKLISSGEIMSESFLPRFAKQLEKEFGGGLDKASRSARANLNRIENSFTNLKLLGGQVMKPLIAEFTPLAVRTSEWTKTVNINSESVVRWAKEGIKIIKILAVYKTFSYSSLKVLKFLGDEHNVVRRAMMLYRLSVAASTIQTKGFSKALIFTKTAWKGMSDAMKSNFIGLAAAGITMIAMKIWNVAHATNSAKNAQKGYNDELERTNIIQQKQRIDKLLKEIGVTKEIGPYTFHAGMINFTKLNEIISNPSKSSLESLEDLKSALEAVGTETQRQIDFIQKKTPGLKGFQEGFQERLKLQSIQRILYNVDSELKKYDKSTVGGGVNFNDVSNTTENIVSGGSRPTNITINLQKLQDKTEIHATTFKEGVQDMEKAVLEGLLRVLNGSQKLATQ